MIRVLAVLVAMAMPAAAAETPQVTVSLDPGGPVIVGTPVSVSVTVLVPTFMPQPPQWPDLQIADAVTRLPARATTPVTRRVGAESWSGLTRRYEIVPQRAADYDLSGATVTLTWAAGDGQPESTTLPVPDIAFVATVPPGAAGLDPFLAATALSVAAEATGLPAAPKPGDALTLTLTTTASGPPAMLLPPLADSLATVPGLRAYPKEPSLTDAPGERGGPPVATRVDAITYVVEAPGSYTLPGVSVAWWNTSGNSVASAETAPIAFTVAAPPGWKAEEAGGEARRRITLVAIGLAGVVLIAGAMLLRRRRRARATPHVRAEPQVYRALRRSVRADPAGGLRADVLDWLKLLAPGVDLTPDLETPLRALERSAYGKNAAGAGDARRALLAALAARRRALRARTPPERRGLPALNPT